MTMTLNPCLLSKGSPTAKAWHSYLPSAPYVLSSFSVTFRITMVTNSFGNLLPPRNGRVNFRVSWKRGALGYITNRKTEEKKSSKTAKPQKNSAKTENRIQNRQKPIWWQVGHTKQTKLTLISPKYLLMSWTLSEAFVSFFVCFNHRLCFCRSLEPRLCGSISEKPLVMEPS